MSVQKKIVMGVAAAATIAGSSLMATPAHAMYVSSAAETNLAIAKARSVCHVGSTWKVDNGYLPYGGDAKFYSQGRLVVLKKPGANTWCATLVNITGKPLAMHLRVYEGGALHIYKRDEGVYKSTAGPLTFTTIPTNQKWMAAGVKAWFGSVTNAQVTGANGVDYDVVTRHY